MSFDEREAGFKAELSSNFLQFDAEMESVTVDMGTAFSDEVERFNANFQDTDDFLTEFSDVQIIGGSDVSVEVRQTSTGAIITVTDKDGTESAVIRHGKDGVDGYTPVKGVDYFDGEPGKDGEPGPAGADGYTPQKGVDYWTDVDKQEIISELSPPISAAGMLIYVDADGNYAYLSLGSGLSVVDGVLTLNGTITPDQPNDTTAVLGAATLGTMVLGNGG